MSFENFSWEHIIKEIFLLLHGSLYELEESTCKHVKIVAAIFTMCLLENSLNWKETSIRSENLILSCAVMSVKSFQSPLHYSPVTVYFFSFIFLFIYLQLFVESVDNVNIIMNICRLPLYLYQYMEDQIINYYFHVLYLFHISNHTFWMLVISLIDN